MNRLHSIDGELSLGCLESEKDVFLWNGMLRLVASRPGQTGRATHVISNQYGPVRLIQHGST